MQSIFHFAFNVTDLDKACDFYTNVLSCQQGRRSDTWVDYNFFGHQLVIHYKETLSEVVTNPVDGKAVPVPHFGVVLDWDKFHVFAEKLKEKNIEFIIEPYIRFEGQVGEQATMFFEDPCNNALEFKAFKDMSQLFAK